MPDYDDPNKRMEQFLKDWAAVLWGWAKWAVRMAIWTIKSGWWVFEEAIPRNRKGGRRYF